MLQKIQKAAFLIVQDLSGVFLPKSVLNSEEGFIEIEINNEKAVILTIPYPSEKRLNEVLYKDMDEEEEK